MTAAEMGNSERDLDYTRGALLDALPALLERMSAQLEELGRRLDVLESGVGVDAARLTVELGRLATELNGLQGARMRHHRALEELAHYTRAAYLGVGEAQLRPIAHRFPRLELRLDELEGLERDV